MEILSITILLSIVMSIVALAVSVKGHTTSEKSSGGLKSNRELYKLADRLDMMEQSYRAVESSNRELKVTNEKLATRLSEVESSNKELWRSNSILTKTVRELRLENDYLKLTTETLAKDNEATKRRLDTLEAIAKGMNVSPFISKVGGR